MPYITETRKRELAEGDVMRNAGDLNYKITQLFIEYLTHKGKSYQDVHDAIGAARDAADELKRRVMDGYEDQKVIENGDVYPTWLIDPRIKTLAQYHEVMFSEAREIDERTPLLQKLTDLTRCGHCSEMRLRFKKESARCVAHSTPEYLAITDHALQIFSKVYWAAPAQESVGENREIPKEVWDSLEPNAVIDAHAAHYTQDRQPAAQGNDREPE